MYTIGEFAAFGRVSARMLRHYDTIGLLTPEQVDERTGYRRYSAAQVHQLLRIVELRQLGVGLERVGAVLTADDEVEATRAALLDRARELEAGLAEDTARLARIRRRLQLLEGTTTMSETVTYRSLDPVTVYAVTGVAPGMGPENVSPMIGPLIERLDRALVAAGRPMPEPAVFWYEDGQDETLTVHVSYTAESEPQAGEGYDVVELPTVPRAATVLHRGDMSGIGDSWMALFEQLVADGYRIAGPTREVYLEAEGHIPGPGWVTELQVPVDAV